MNRMNHHGKVVIGKDEKSKVIITVRTGRGTDKSHQRHIIITAPAEMKWEDVLVILKKLPKHLKKE